ANGSSRLPLWSLGQVLDHPLEPAPHLCGSRSHRRGLSMAGMEATGSIAVASVRPEPTSRTTTLQGAWFQLCPQPAKQCIIFARARGAAYAGHQRSWLG